MSFDTNHNKDRIAKRIANLGYCSRRDAEKLILAGKVQVNGQLINTPVFLVAKKDKITVNDVLLVESKVDKLFAYYKPKGLVCSNKDERNRPTIFDCLPEEMPRVVYIGRLDLNSEGLLLLTTNGAVGNAVLLPNLGLKRTYKVRAYGSISQKELDKLALGVSINGVHYQPIVANVLKKNGSNIWLEFTLQEGKNREIRNICDYLGLTVNRLIRTSFGPFMLGNMVEGEVRELDFSKLQKILDNSKSGGNAKR